MSQGISLTPEQREAAHLLDADCIVSAGGGGLRQNAGSGGAVFAYSFPLRG